MKAQYRKMLLRLLFGFLYSLLLSQIVLAEAPAESNKGNELAQFKGRDKGMVRQGDLQVHQSNPSFDKPFYNLARRAEIQTYRAEIIAWYQQYIQMTTNSQAAAKAKTRLIALQKLQKNDLDSKELQNRLYQKALMHAQALWEKNDLLSALNKAESATEIDSNRFEAYLMAGSLYITQQQCEQAQPFLNKAFTLSESTIDKQLIKTTQQQCEQEQAYQILMRQAAKQSKARQFAQAAKFYEKAWLQHKYHYEAGLAAATHFSLSKDYKTSRKLLEQLLKSPSSAIVFEAKRNLRDLQVAMMFATKSDTPVEDKSSIEKIPGREAYLKAVDLLKKNHLDAAEKQLDSAIKAIPFHSRYGDYFYCRGEINLKQKDYKQSINDLRLAAMLKPESAKIYAKLGQAYFYEKAYEEAIDIYNQGLFFVDEELLEINLYYLMGQANYAKGDYPEAIKNLKHYLKTSPGNASYQNNAQGLLDKIQTANALENVFQGKAYQLMDESNKNEPVSLEEEIQPSKLKQNEKQSQQFNDFFEQALDDL